MTRSHLAAQGVTEQSGRRDEGCCAALMLSPSPCSDSCMAPSEPGRTLMGASPPPCCSLQGRSFGSHISELRLSLPCPHFAAALHGSSCAEQDTAACDQVHPSQKYALGQGNLARAQKNCPRSASFTSAKSPFGEQSQHRHLREPEGWRALRGYVLGGMGQGHRAAGRKQTSQGKGVKARQITGVLTCIEETCCPSLCSGFRHAC